jgi:hypothetical protein
MKFLIVSDRHEIIRRVFGAADAGADRCRMRWKGTSSFVHAAFVALLDHFPYAEVKARLRVIESTRQINDVIKTRLDRSSKAAA